MTSESAMSPLVRKAEDAAQATIGKADDLPCLAELLVFLERVPDPRKRRGRRHTLACLLAVAMAAVLAGARSFTAIGEWAGDASEAVLATLGVRRNRRTGRVVAPDEATLRRAAQRIDPDVLDDTLAAWVASRHDARLRAVALDGKTVRGARDHADPTSRAPHLMAAVDHADATVVSQRQVDDKSNEITAARPLLEPLDLEGVVVTADAIHTQRDLAEWLVATRLAHYLLIVKANQPTLYQTVQDALAGTNEQFADRSHTETCKGHGRIETRTIRTASVADLEGIDIDFPHAAQIFRIIRVRAGLDGQRTSKEVVYGITSMPTPDAGPAHIAEHARGHWTIENKLHYVRDVTWGEDHSQVRTGTEPRFMASIRNLGLSLLRVTGVTNIAKALRHNARDATRPLKLLALKPIQESQ